MNKFVNAPTIRHKFNYSQLSHPLCMYMYTLKYNILKISGSVKFSSVVIVVYIVYMDMPSQDQKFNSAKFHVTSGKSI